MPEVADKRVPCTEETQRELWNAKRDGETFDSLLQKMLDQYDPETSREASTNGTTSKS